MQLTYRLKSFDFSVITDHAHRNSLIHCPDRIIWLVWIFQLYYSETTALIFFLSLISLISKSSQNPIKFSRFFLWEIIYSLGKIYGHEWRGAESEEHQFLIKQFTQCHRENEFLMLLIAIPGRPIVHVVLTRYFQGNCHGLITMGFFSINLVSSHLVKIMHWKSCLS